MARRRWCGVAHARAAATIFDDAAVVQPHHALAMRRDRRIVRDDDDRHAVLMQVAEHAHDLARRLLSRLPVGSSASSTSGRPTSALAIATRCRWPPESSLGLCSTRSSSPTRASAALARSRRTRREAAIDQRLRDVVGKGGARHQVVALEDEADLAIAHAGELVFERPATASPSSVYVPVVGIEAPEHVHHRRLAGPDGPTRPHIHCAQCPD